jgi:hypothetical protein
MAGAEPANGQEIREAHEKMKHRAQPRTMPKLERPPWGSEEPMSTQEAEA